jgi:hypothetical protein
MDDNRKTRIAIGALVVIGFVAYLIYRMARLNGWL